MVFNSVEGNLTLTDGDMKSILVFGGHKHKRLMMEIR
jgi:hypothetical protein